MLHTVFVIIFVQYKLYQGQDEKAKGIRSKNLKGQDQKS